jgi:hypothetical protein
MSTYHPDLWVIVELTSKKGTHHRVLASWYGGYTSGNSWKFSSGIEGVEIESTPEGNFYSMPQTSGSTYVCHENNYGMSGYTTNVFASYQKEADESDGELALKLLTEEEAKAYLASLESQND